MDRADVLVAGTGPAGSAAAIALADAGLCVRLAGRAAPRTLPPAVECLTPELVSQLVLRGYRDLLEQPAVGRPCTGVKSIWAGPQVHFRDYFSACQPNGLVLDRAVFDSYLLKQAAAHGVECYDDVRIVGATADVHGITVRACRGGKAWTCRTRFLIDATGKAAVVARQFGARRRRFTRQAASAVELGPVAEAKDRGMLWIEADTEGWWSGAVGPAGTRHLVRFGGANVNPGGPGLAHLIRNSRMMCEFASPAELDAVRPWRMDAGCSAVDLVAGDRWLAVGDAALAFDPVASQGLPHAFASAATAADAVIKFLDGSGLCAMNNYVRRTANTLQLHLVLLREHYRNQHS